MCGWVFVCCYYMLYVCYLKLTSNILLTVCTTEPRGCLMSVSLSALLKIEVVYFFFPPLCEFDQVCPLKC